MARIHPITSVFHYFLTKFTRIFFPPLPGGRFCGGDIISDFLWPSSLSPYQDIISFTNNRTRACRDELPTDIDVCRHKICLHNSDRSQLFLFQKMRNSARDLKFPTPTGRARSLRAQKVRHATLPNLYEMSISPYFWGAGKQSESDDLQFLRRQIQDPAAADISAIQQLLMRTCFESVKKEIYTFVHNSLGNPLELLEYRRRRSIIPRSSSSENIAHAISEQTGRRDSFSITPSKSVAHLDETVTDAPEAIARIESEEDLDKTQDTLLRLLKLVPEMLHDFGPTEVSEIFALMPQILVTLAPNPLQIKDKGVPNFHYFKAAAKCAERMVRLCNDQVALESDALDLGKMVIMAYFTICGNIVDVVRMTKSKMSQYLNYTGALMPFMASLVAHYKQDPNNSGFLLLLQQFWIAVVALSAGDVTYYLTAYPKPFKELVMEMPPLLSSEQEINFGTLSCSVNDMMTFLKFQLIPDKQEEVANAFCRIATTVKKELVMSLPLADAILLLAIAILEKVRASIGYFSPMLEYFTTEYYPEFSECLNGLIQPVFASYQTHASGVQSFSKAKEEITPVLAKIFEHYNGHNQRLLPFIDAFAKPLVAAHPLCLFDHETMESYIRAYIELKEENSSRLVSFRELGMDMFKRSITTAPYAFRALLEDCLIDKDHIYTNQTEKLAVVLELLPRECNNEFVNELMVKSVTCGSFRYINPLDLIVGGSQHDRMLLIGMSFVKSRNTQLITSLLSSSDAPQDLRLMVWSHIVMSSKANGKIFIHHLVKRFNDLTSKGKGIFAEEYSQRHVEFQCAMMRFFNEQVSLYTFTDEILEIIRPMIGRPMLDDARIGKVLLPLSTLVSSAIILPIMTPRFRVSVSKFLLTIIMKIISLRQMPISFESWRSAESEYLEKLISTLPEVTKCLPLQKDIQGVLEDNSHPRKDVELVNAMASFIEQHVIDQQMYKKLGDRVIWILCNLLSLFTTYEHPTVKISGAMDLIKKHWLKPRNFNLNELLFFFWEIYPASIPAVAATIHASDQILGLLPQLLSSFPMKGEMSANLVSLFAKLDASYVARCQLLSPYKAMSLMSPEILGNQEAAAYLMRCFDTFDDISSIFYIPQFVQSLKWDQTEELQKFLCRFARKNPPFAHYLLWNLSHEKQKVTTGEQGSLDLAKLEGLILLEMDADAQDQYENETTFINSISDISASLLPMSFDDRKVALIEKLRDMTFPNGLYVPSNPEYEIIGIDAENSKPLKSHSRVPILVNFDVRKGKEKPTQIACIFKIEDDIRTDALMIQIIDRFQHIFDEAGIDCFLLPYRVLSTGQNRGVIECIQNAKSRHEIGVATKMDLQQTFRARYGQIGSAEYKKAQMNFIKSMAPYSLICYLFQVKDRHNANIMIDEEGHIMHIDFGFIFDISPGGNMKFERAPFKLTNEMVALMGGDTKSYPFRHFTDLLTRCFIAVRERYDELEAIGLLLKDAGMNCFKQESFKRLRDRFLMDKPDSEIQAHIESLVNSSIGSMTTTAYDAFQSAQNSIFYV